jgi:chloride channel protein, CIC family
LGLSTDLEKLIDKIGWKDLNVSYLRKWTIVAIFIGLVSGGATIAFYISVQVLSSFFLGLIVGYTSPAHGGASSLSSTYYLSVDRVWMIPLVLGGVGILIGLISSKLAPETKGDGIENVIETFHTNRGSIRARVAAIRPVISSLALGAGASGGPEGPMGQIASTFGTLIGKLFRLDEDEVRIAIVSGMGAGIGSIMRLPFGGALFSIELLYGRDFVIKSLFPVMIASLTSYAVSGIYLGWLPILNIPQMTVATLSIEAISGYVVIAVIVGLCSIFYTKIIDLVRRYFEKAKIAPFIRPAIGCALVGLFAVGLPEILGTGYGWLQIAIDDNFELLPLWLIMGIILVKTFATAITVGSGTGVSFFGPTLVIGGLMGAAVISIFHMLGLFVSVEVPSAVVVSMFAFFAAGTKTPFSSIAMGTEVAGGYFLLLPLIIAIPISYAISGKNNSIYKNNVSGFSIRNKKTGKNPLLQQLKVGVVMDHNFYDLAKETGINEAIHVMNETDSTSMIVTDSEDKLEGIIHYRNLIESPEESKSTMRVENVMIKDAPFLLPSDTLQKALEIMVKSGHSELFVVSPADSKLVVGVLSLNDISSACNEKEPILLDLENMDRSDLSETTKSSQNLPTIGYKIGPSSKQFLAKLKNYWPIQ